MAPIFAAAILSYIPVPLILTLTVQQGNTMDTRLGSVHISPATLFLIPTVFQMATLVVYDRVVDYRGWDAGFAVCAAVVLLGLLVWAAGIPTYRNKVPAGSPITRIMQVLVVAFKKRNLQLPSNPDELYQPTEHDSLTGHEILQRTPGLKCLDKAAIVEHGSSSGGGNGGGRGAWSLCSVWQVEETKIVARMVPIFLTATLGYMPVSVILTFTVQQGNTMDTRLGRIRVSPAMLFAIPTVFQMAILVVYDRAVVPALRRATGRVGGVTHLQRIGVGFVFSMAACAAGPHRSRGGGDKEEGRRRPDVRVLADAAVLPPRRRGRHLLRGAPRVLLQRGVHGDEVHRQLHLLLHPRRVGVARQPAHPGHQPRHAACRRRRRGRGVAGRGQPERRQARPVLRPPLRHRGGGDGDLRVLGEEVCVQE
uniref:Uncharacterized protein n=1 Tax=Oryza brachyantha TaxID=4533 RepID=J3N7H6_ORYBR